LDEGEVLDDLGQKSSRQFRCWKYAPDVRGGHVTVWLILRFLRVSWVRLVEVRSPILWRPAFATGAIDGVLDLFTGLVDGVPGKGQGVG
jgi:hypothetical protein